MAVLVHLFIFDVEQINITSKKVQIRSFVDSAIRLPYRNYGCLFISCWDIKGQTGHKGST
jgi:hypothetical protein